MQHWSTPPCACPAVPSDLISFLPFPPSFLDVQAQLKNYPQEACIPTVLFEAAITPLQWPVCKCLSLETGHSVDTDYALPIVHFPHRKAC